MERKKSISIIEASGGSGGASGPSGQSPIGYENQPRIMCGAGGLADPSFAVKILIALYIMFSSVSSRRAKCGR